MLFQYRATVNKGNIVAKDRYSFIENFLNQNFPARNVGRNKVTKYLNIFMEAERS